MVRRLNDPCLVWISFRACLRPSMSFWSGRELVSEKEALLRELQALFEEDNLLGDPRQVVVVPARDAYPEYLEYGAYVCQPRRSFRPVERMAFYCRGQIEREIPLIRHVLDEVEFSRENADVLRTSGKSAARETAELIERLLEAGPRQEGEFFKVFLLTGAGDPETVILERLIRNDATDASGRTIAWVRNQRYTSLAALRKVHRTSELSEDR
jgi:hypothetical protein